MRLRGLVAAAMAIACLHCDAVFGLHQGPVVDGSPGDSAPNSGANKMFVTSATVTGVSLGGRAGADALCAQAARAANLDGTFVAFLDDGGGDPSARLGSARGWVRTDGLPFADRIADIVNGAIFYPPRKDETGTDVAVDAPVLTSGIQMCTSGSATAHAGNAWFTTGEWDSHTGVTCSQQLHLYCFETDRAVQVGVGSGSGRLAFLTVKPFVPGGSGLASADQLCGSEAAAAQLPGTFLALLAVGSASAISRFDTSGPPWIRLDGVAIATTALELEAQNWQTALNVTSAGTYADTTVYSGGNSLVSFGTSTCNDWLGGGSSATLRGFFGEAASSGAEGIDFANDGSCSGMQIYCLQP